MKTWFGLPLLARFVIFLVAVFGCAFLGFLLADIDHLEDGDRVVGWTVLATVTTLLMAQFMFRFERGLRHDFGSIERFLVYRQVLATGELPEHIDVETWRRWVHRSRLRNRFTWVRGWVVVGVGLWWLHESVDHWPLSLACVLVGWWILIASLRTRPRIVRLAGEVDRIGEEAEARRQMICAAAAPEDEQPAADPAPPRGAQPRPTKWELIVGWPLLVRVCWFTAGRFTVAALIVLAADPDFLLTGSAWTPHLQQAAWWGIPMGLLTVGVMCNPLLRATESSVEQLRAYDAFLYTGELPEHIDAELWQRWLKGSLISDSAQRLGFAAFYMAVGIFALLTQQSLYHWAIAALFQLAAVRCVQRWRVSTIVITRVLSARVRRHAVRQLWG